jgi:hypothetical protein
MPGTCKTSSSSVTHLLDNCIGQNDSPLANDTTAVLGTAQELRLLLAQSSLDADSHGTRHNRDRAAPAPTPDVKRNGLPRREGPGL